MSTTESVASARSSCAVTTHELIRTRVESWLREEARLPQTAIQVDTPLLELGIDSLGVAEISDDLARQTGKRVNPEVLFELENISQIAQYLDSLPVISTNGGGATAEVNGAMANVATLTDSSIPTDASAATDSAAPANGPPVAADPREHFELLNRRVRALQAQGLYFFETELESHEGAWVVSGGRRMLMLGSYEYLGLLDHPRLKQASIAALEQFGTGHHGARLLTGTTTLHRALERKLASFMGSEEALLFSSGYVTNVSTIATLVDRSCCVIGDEWNHASIVDGCRASGAEFWTFAHNDMDALAARLAETGGRRTLVVVDAVFSMDGDIINLPAVVELCQRHRALLMVDEAHSLGVLGATGRGIQEHFGLADDAIDVKMGTLSKTLANTGGFVAGRESIITFLRHHARGYIFSGALPNPPVAASLAALEILEQHPELVQRLRDNRDYYLAGLRKLGFDCGRTQTPIVPVMTWTDECVLEMTRLCRSHGLLVVPVAYPAVPLHSTRLRTCVSAAHSTADLDFALDVLAQAGRQTGLIR